MIYQPNKHREGEEAFSFFFLCFCIYERQEYSQNRLNLVVSILTCLLLFILYTYVHEYKKEQREETAAFPLRVISLYKLAQQLLQEQLAIGLESSLPYWPITGPSPRMPPT